MHAKKFVGSIEVIFGPMFAGKTTELLRKVKTYTIAHKKCLVVCSAKDNRYTTENFVVSHDKITSKAMKVSSLEEILPYYHDYDVIAIDEGQFFPDITDKAENLLMMERLF